VENRRLDHFIKTLDNIETTYNMLLNKISINVKGDLLFASELSRKFTVKFHVN